MTGALSRTMPSSGPPPQPSPRGLVPVLAFAGVVVSLQQTVVIPILPQLHRLIGASQADATWAVTATLLAGAVAMPMVGRLADMWGRRRLLLICLMVLVAGSVLAAMSTSLVPLVAGRALQGLATGVVPLGISLMRDRLPPDRLGPATSLMSASLGVGGALGLPLSALIAQYADWHVLFWAGGGLAAVAAVLVRTVVAEPVSRAGGRFDPLGALLLAVALAGLLLAISKGGSWGWGSAVTLSLLGAAVVVLPVFGAWELRTRHPLVDLRVSRRRQVLLTNIASMAFGYSLLTGSLAFTQLLQLPAGSGFGTSMLAAGLLQAPGGLCMMAMSPVSARISGSAGPRRTLLIGAFVVAAGYGFAALCHGHVWQVVAGTIVIGCGIGLAYGALPMLIMAAVPAGQTAAANSLNNLCRALGTTVAGTVTGVLLTAGGAVPADRAFVVVLLIGAATAVAALIAAALLPARNQGRAEVRPARK